MEVPELRGDFLAALQSLWMRQIERAKQVKQKQFDETADRAWKFYGDSTHKFLFDENDLQYTLNSARGMPRPSHPVTVNLTNEYVRLFLPFLHTKAPTRLVTPRRPMLPQELQALVGPPQNQDTERLRAYLMQWVLNYTPDLYDLHGHGRLSLIEALVKGRGLVWHHIVDGLPTSQFDSVDHLYLDPDGEQLQHCAFAIRKRVRPAWAVAEDFGIKKEELKGRYDSHQKKAREWVSESTPDNEEGDVVVYYEVYSRMGIGSRFVAADDDLKKLNFDELGPYVFLCVMPGMDSPLNLYRGHIYGGMPWDEIKARLTWPLPLWAYVADPWPFTSLDFLKHPRRAWPTSTLESALPLQEFLDYSYSAAMTRIKQSSRSLIFTSKALGTELTNALSKSNDLSVVPTNLDTDDIRKYIHFQEFPGLPAEYFQICEKAEQLFRQNTCMTELMYGASSRQMRSSAEATIRQQNMSTRPEDMADMVEAWHSTQSAKEAIAMRLYTPAQKFAQLAGEPQGSMFLGPMAQAWNNLVTTDDPMLAAAEFTYNVVAGSGRKASLQKQMTDMQTIMQTALPLAMQRVSMGDVRMYNALWQMWGEAYQSDVTKIMLDPQQEQQRAQQMQQMQQQPQR